MLWPCGFFFFSLLIWWIRLIGFPMLNQLCIPSTNSTGSRCISFLYIARFNLLIFCYGFLHLCSWGIWVCSFLLPLLNFGIRVMLASWNESGSVLFYFLRVFPPCLFLSLALWGLYLYLFLYFWLGERHLLGTTVNSQQQHQSQSPYIT